MRRAGSRRQQPAPSDDRGTTKARLRDRRRSAEPSARPHARQPVGADARSELRWTLSRPGFGADNKFDTIEGDIARTWSRGKNSLQVGLGYATTLQSDNTVQDFFTLGGFLRLSGLERGEISGPHAALARLVYYRRVGETTGGILDTPVYLGVSAESGNVWQSRKMVVIWLTSETWRVNELMGFFLERLARRKVVGLGQW